MPEGDGSAVGVAERPYYGHPRGERGHLIWGPAQRRRHLEGDAVAVAGGKGEHRDAAAGVGLVAGGPAVDRLRRARAQPVLVVGLHEHRELAGEDVGVVPADPSSGVISSATESEVDRCQPCGISVTLKPGSWAPV